MGWCMGGDSYNVLGLGTPCNGMVYGGVCWGGGGGGGPE